MASRRVRTTAAAAAASLAAALVAALPAAPAAADVYGPPRVTRDADAHALATVYDPDDALGLDGDTHELEIDAAGLSPIAIQLYVTSYTCGPHDVTRRPSELGCAGNGTPSLPVRRARVDVLDDDTARLRGTTPTGRIDLTLTGFESLPGMEPFVSHEWDHAVGVTRERGRTVAADFLYARLDAGTLGGLALYQDADWLPWSGMRVRTSTVRKGVGPAVAIPDLPPPGTEDGEWSTYANAGATWLRHLPSAGPAGTRDVEVGEAGYEVSPGGFGGPAGGFRDVQRCEPGERVVLNNVPQPRRPCEIVDIQGGTDNASADLDLAAGRVGVEFDFVSEAPGGPNTHVTFAWQGAHAVDYHLVDVRRYDAVASVETFTREGVRWRRLDADGTVGGRPVDQVLGLDFTVYRQKREMAPPP